MLKGEEHAPGHYAIGFDRHFLHERHGLGAHGGGLMGTRAEEWADLVMPVYGRAPEPGHVVSVVRLAMEAARKEEREARAITRVLDAWEEAKTMEEETQRGRVAGWIRGWKEDGCCVQVPMDFWMALGEMVRGETVRARREEREACARELEKDDVSELPHWPATQEEMGQAWAVRRAAARAMRARAGG